MLNYVWLFAYTPPPTELALLLITFSELRVAFEPESIKIPPPFGAELLASSDELIFTLDYDAMQTPPPALFATELLLMLHQLMLADTYSYINKAPP